MTKIETKCLICKMTKIEINLLYINYKNRDCVLYVKMTKIEIVSCM